ncbi:DUF1266 domain-containing protein [Flavobacterium psychrophilum]|uniref:DUF1266 domain-containing protein n=1 Tax=Flavobacterium psychrophilum TaxID=96345 RepID=A0A7U2RA75_FLAPS|nr:DUF1266 domain-containing protein [Flavobacterium psychrophilum]EKT4550724.1 DUF1266 domain-containing protein [Flavobacterium psychrophilum]ELM3645066.1 DUF1266 domain-containing protein [Flavobacterium psychrophilum]ELY1980140.1 DUF1266 domain-containing protein [Flavobacterium psychrophilum]MBF2092132.1 DUF1266 domain-containing protein [Flavobacterium psychrophilum]OAE90352.1 hypothetical protein SU65_11455 [Flavobacterium psychrophilum]
MFKFIKELISSVKEGIDEANEELKEEELSKQKEITIEYEKNVKELKKLSYTEKFGTALCAPFRAIYFGDMFSLFKSDEDLNMPLHLYSFGKYPLSEEQKKEFSDILKRDFDIVDRGSCLNMLKTFFCLVHIDVADTILATAEITSIDTSMWDMKKIGSSTLLSSVSSHIITASTDIGFLGKVEALVLLNRIIDYTKQNNRSWENYSENFIIGEKNVGLNNFMGRKVISKYISYLKEKKGSPWNNIMWSQT